MGVAFRALKIAQKEALVEMRWALLQCRAEAKEMYTCAKRNFIHSAANNIWFSYLLKFLFCMRSHFFDGNPTWRRGK